MSLLFIIEHMEDKKIESRYREWEAAQARKDKFLGRLLNGTKFEGHDPFEFMLAYAEADRAYLYYDLALSEKYRDQYRDDQIKDIKNEIVRLNKRIKSLQNRQWPSLHRK